MDTIIKSNRPVLNFRKPILITMESFSAFKDAKVVSECGYFIECTLMVCDEISRNNTFYPLEDMRDSLRDDRRYQEALTNNVAFGEAEHPTGKNGEKLSMERFMSVDMKEVCCRVDNYWVDGNKIRGVVELCGPYGDAYRNYIVKSGSNMAMSIRSYTPTYVNANKDGKAYVIKKHMMYTTSFDMVRLPGLRGARMIDPDTFSSLRNDKTIVRAVESSKGVFTEVSFHDPVSEIRQMMRSTEGASFISDTFGVNFDNAKMVLGQDTLQVSSESGTLELPLATSLLSTLL